MNFPHHLMTKTAVIRFAADYSLDSSAQALPQTDTVWDDVPCRIQADSATDSMVVGGQLGAISYSAWFPSAQVAFDELGITDFNVPANARVEIGDVYYRVVGPGVNRGVEDPLQECRLETWNQEQPGE